jgi:prepilin-type N-terminal cleavage/methylation domain-containing protein
MARASEGGFSLIEMLIATTLFGFLSTMMVGGLHLGTRVMESGAKRIESNSRVNAGYDFLRREIAQAQPLAFDGRPDRLTFVSFASPHRPTGGYQQITLRPERGRLVATWRPYDRDGGAGGSARDSLLLDDVAVEFTYFGVIEGEGAPRWHREWRGQAPPSLVGIAVFRGDGRMAPGLMVAPRLAGGPADG